MTRPKLRPCPTCQTLNKASIKTCTVCYGTLSTKKKLIEKAATLDGQWGQGVVRNRNVSRIIDSAHIAVLKLEALGFKPILFYGHRDKKSQNKWVADVMTHFAPSSLTKHILDKMRRAYEILLTKAEQSQTFTEEQPAEQPQSPGAEQPEPTSGAEQPEPPSGAEQPEPTSGAEQPEPTSGAEQPEPTSGAEQPQSPGAEQPEPTTGAEQPEPTSGAEQPEPTSGAEQPEPTSGAEQPQPEFIVLNLVTCPTSPSSSLPTYTNMPPPQTSSPPQKEGQQKKKKITVVKPVFIASPGL
ncbi:Circumsporozoite protein [Dissostichus eleginoides]|uniref:Circumsporozoite protein n=1 Tax=Dissostichus eleginoides TaxID=100907 RepID=A0AAD9BQN6_DISEL|nr:Circumsporozoite protein [Dissostichus eleginoides]